MSNILAIANKELRSYFNSPIAYAVIGFFAFAFGFMFWAFLRGFVAESMRMSMNQMGASGTVNINQMMLRPLVMQISVIVLFMLPMVTMRTYAEEKRSGTIELLLTAPLTDVQIILGKFLGAVGALRRDARWSRCRACSSSSPTATPTGSRSRRPTSGCSCSASSFIAFGLFISSLTQNQIIAGVLTFVLLLMLLLVGWLKDFVTSPVALTAVSAVSVFEHFDDFTKGVLDTKHIAYYVSVITFGLFLTARSVDGERWRG